MLFRSEINKKEPSYTYDTLMEIKENYLNAEFYEIIGEDSFNYFVEWKNYKEILKNSKIIVLKRKNRNEDERKNILKDIKLKERFIYIENEHFNYSSTNIRKNIELGKPITNMVPSLVEKYIEKNNLYRKNNF